MHIKRFVLGDLSTNCYVIDDESTKTAAVIDPAVCNEKIIKYIDDAQLNIKYILLTHGHFDHIIGCKELAVKYNAKVLISETEAHIIDDLNREFTNASVADSIRIDGVLNEGDSVTVGNITLDVIATPGHTPGGVAFYADGVIFSGDTLFKASIGRTDFYKGSFEQLSQSVRKLYAYPDETVVYPGHGFTTTIGYEKNSNPYVRGI